MEVLQSGKLEADGLFKEDKHAEAIARYESLLQDLDSVVAAAGSGSLPLEEGGGGDEDTAASYILLKKSVLNNLSMVLLRTEQYDACVERCTDAILLDSSNLKAYYRRAQAYKALGSSSAEENYFRQGLKDCDAILQIETLNAQAKAMRIEIIKAQQEVETAKKYAYIKADLAEHSHAAKEAQAKSSTTISTGPRSDHASSSSSSSSSAAVVVVVDGSSSAGNEGEGEGEVGPEDVSAVESNANSDTNTATGSYLFMNPNWQPHVASPGGANPNPPSQSASASAFGLVSVSSRGTSQPPSFAPAAPTAPIPTSAVSMKELLREARRSALSSASASAPAPAQSSSPSQPHTMMKKTEQEPPVVTAAISELKQLEAEAAQKVADRLAWKNAQVADKNDRKKGSKYKSALSNDAHAKFGTALLGANNPSALSAWDQLQLDEAEAERKFRLLVLNKASSTGSRSAANS